MRESCLHCVLKHLGQAEVLYGETLMGYPEHTYLVIGHLAEAEAEAHERWPNLADKIRARRIGYSEVGVRLVLMDIAVEVGKLIQESKNSESEDESVE